MTVRSFSFGKRVRRHDCSTLCYKDVVKEQEAPDVLFSFWATVYNQPRTIKCEASSCGRHYSHRLFHVYASVTQTRNTRNPRKLDVGNAFHWYLLVIMHDCIPYRLEKKPDKCYAPSWLPRPLHASNQHALLPAIEARATSLGHLHLPR